jgi:hypothetical protein
LKENRSKYQSYIDEGFIIPDDESPSVSILTRESTFIKYRPAFVHMCGSPVGALVLEYFMYKATWQVSLAIKNDMPYSDQTSSVKISCRDLVNTIMNGTDKTIRKEIDNLIALGYVSKKSGVFDPSSNTRDKNTYRVHVSKVRDDHDAAISRLDNKSEASKLGIPSPTIHTTDCSNFTVTDQNSPLGKFTTEDDPGCSKFTTAAVVNLPKYKNLRTGLFKNRRVAVKDVDILTKVEYADRVVSASEDINEGCSGNDRSSGNEESLVITEPLCQGIRGIERLANVEELDSTQTSMGKNVETKTDAEREENSSRQEDAPTAQLSIQESGSMEDVEIFIKGYHKRVPLRDRSSSKNRESRNVGGLLKANGDKVERLLGSYSVEDLLEGLEGFLADDYWKGQGYPLRGYLSQVSKYCQESPQDESEPQEVRRYQKTETIEPCPASASNPAILDEIRRSRVKSRALELKRIADRCSYQLDIDLDDPGAVESNFGPVLDAFRSKLGFDYPVTTQPCPLKQT